MALPAIGAVREPKWNHVILVALSLILMLTIHGRMRTVNPGGGVTKLTIQSEAPITSEQAPPEKSKEPDRARNEVAVPAYLQGLLPHEVETLTIQDIAGSHRKLVGWSRLTDNGWDTHVELISAIPGRKAERLWQSKAEDGSYEPQIRFIPGCKHGRQTYLILRQLGSMWQTATPTWIEGDSVRSLPTIEAEYFELKRLEPGQFDRLIGYSRAPVPFEMPTIYRLAGNGFVLDTSSHREFYRKLAEERRDSSGEERACPGFRYGEAVLLVRAGLREDALKILTAMRSEVSTSDDSELIGDWADTLDELGARGEVLKAGLVIRDQINACKGEVEPYRACVCAAILEGHGKRAEALQLLNKVRKTVKDSCQSELIGYHKQLVSKLTVRHIARR